MLHADDIEYREDVANKLKTWRKVMEEIAMRVGTCDAQQMVGLLVRDINYFMYLDLIVLMDCGGR